MLIQVLSFLIIFYSILPAYAETSCAELNRLYKQKYIHDFSIDVRSFETNINTIFRCSGFDKNFIMARAINDLDILRPTNSKDPDYYAAVSEVMRLNGTSLNYWPRLKYHPKSEARTIHYNGESTIFFTKRMIKSKERFRPTYSLVHEARHTLKYKPDIPTEPGHIVCTRNKNKGKRVCDSVLGKVNVLISGSGNSHEFLFLKFVRDHPKASVRIEREAQAQMNYLATYLFNKLEPGILKYYNVKLLK